MSHLWLDVSHFIKDCDFLLASRHSPLVASRKQSALVEKAMRHGTEGSLWPSCSGERRPSVQQPTRNWIPPTTTCGEGNGNPLQYSCLENPMDRGAWWAAVQGVARSRTRLSNFTFTFHFHALEKDMATHSSVLAWRNPGTGEPGGLPSMGLHRVGHNWSDLAVAAAATTTWMNLKAHSPGWIFRWDHSPSQCLDYYDRPWAEDPAKYLDSWPTDTVRLKSGCFFKLLNCEIICYTVTDN